MIFEILPKFSIEYEKNTGILSFNDSVYETYKEISDNFRKDILNCLLNIEAFKNNFKKLNLVSLFDIAENDFSRIISQPDPVRDSSVEVIINYYETLCKLIKIPDFYSFIKSNQILLSKFAYSDGFLQGLLDNLAGIGFIFEIDYKKPLFDYKPAISKICSDLDNLRQLIVTPSPSGFETKCQRVFEKIIESYGGHRFYSDHIGNVAYSFGNAKGKRILLSAHIDELGFQVLDITEEGFLIVTSLGGIDMKVTQAASVMVEGRGIWFPGVVGKRPIHAETREDRESVSSIEEVKIDLGMTKEDLKNSGIEIGSVVVYSRPTNTDNLNLWLGNKNIYSPGLDDKVGIYVILEIAKRLKDINTDYEIIIASCVQEELGLRGATVLAQNIKPDISIDIDVTPSSDFGVKSEVWGNMKLGEGPIIELGPGNSPRLWKLFIEQAKEKNIKFQRVVGGPGGTNTDVFQRFGNCETQLISLPIRNLHTPTESCNVYDIGGAVDLITEVIKSSKL